MTKILATPLSTSPEKDEDQKFKNGIETVFQPNILPMMKLPTQRQRQKKNKSLKQILVPLVIVWVLAGTFLIIYFLPECIVNKLNNFMGSNEEPISKFHYHQYENFAPQSPVNSQNPSFYQYQSPAGYGNINYAYQPATLIKTRNQPNEVEINDIHAVAGQFGSPEQGNNNPRVPIFYQFGDDRAGKEQNRLITALERLNSYLENVVGAIDVQRMQSTSQIGPDRIQWTASSPPFQAQLIRNQITNTQYQGAREVLMENYFSDLIDRQMQPGLSRHITTFQVPSSQPIRVMNEPNELQLRMTLLPIQLIIDDEVAQQENYKDDKAVPNSSQEFMKRQQILNDRKSENHENLIDGAANTENSDSKLTVALPQDAKAYQLMKKIQDVISVRDEIYRNLRLKSQAVMEANMKNLFSPYHDAEIDRENSDEIYWKYQKLSQGNQNEAKQSLNIDEQIDDAEKNKTIGGVVYDEVPEVDNIRETDDEQQNENANEEEKELGDQFLEIQRQNLEMEKAAEIKRQQNAQSGEVEINAEPLIIIGDSITRTREGDLISETEKSIPEHDAVAPEMVNRTTNALKSILTSLQQEILRPYIAEMLNAAETVPKPKYSGDETVSGEISSFESFEIDALQPTQAFERGKKLNGTNSKKDTIADSDSFEFSRENLDNPAGNSEDFFETAIPLHPSPLSRAVLIRGTTDEQNQIKLSQKAQEVVEQFQSKPITN